MKKFFVLAVFIFVTTFYGISSAAITGSAHDFSGAAWNATGEICRVCHAPHDHALAQQYYLQGLLWNHEISSASYTMYDVAWSSSLQGAQSPQPDGTAKLCLACHDGTVAVDAFDQYAGGTIFVSDFNPAAEVPAFMDGASLDLRGTHPISITYDDAADTNLWDPATTAMGLSGVIDDVLDFGKVQCSTCHDVHHSNTMGIKLLRVDNAASGLCLTCHIK